MFHEYQHKVLRRDIITQKGQSRDQHLGFPSSILTCLVLPTNSRGGFSAVLDRAQVILRQKFGMELYELRSKSKGAAMGEEAASQTQTQTQAPAARKKQKGKRLEVIEEDEEEEDEVEEGGAATLTTKSELPSTEHCILQLTILSTRIKDVHPQNNIVGGDPQSHGDAAGFADV